MTHGIESPEVHRLKNQLAIVLGFCELLLAELPADSTHRADVLQIEQAGKSALAILRTPHEDGQAKLAPEAE